MARVQKMVAFGLALPALIAEGQDAMNSDGFKEQPYCSSRESVTETMANQGKFPSGIKAESPRFLLEVFPKTRSDGRPSNTAWTLVGENKKGQLCFISASIISPYRDEPWFKRYFKASDSPIN